MLRKSFLAAALAGVAVLGSSASASLRITEWMYNGTNAEFVEITNIGSTPLDLTGYSYDDDSRAAGTVSLSALGTLAAGESAVFAEAAEATFRSAWNLSAGVKVLGSNGTNLGRSDEINIFDANGDLADRLTFSDQNIAGSIRTDKVSGITLPENYGQNNVLQWFFSAVGDSYGSYASTGGDIGSPGVAVVPEPASLAALGLIGLAGLRRRR